MPTDVSLSDSKCWNGGHEWVNQFWRHYMCYIFYNRLSRFQASEKSTPYTSAIHNLSIRIENGVGIAMSFTPFRYSFLVGFYDCFKLAHNGPRTYILSFSFFFPLNLSLFHLSDVSETCCTCSVTLILLKLFFQNSKYFSKKQYDCI